MNFKDKNSLLRHKQVKKKKKVAHPVSTRKKKNSSQNVVRPHAFAISLPASHSFSHVAVTPSKWKRKGTEGTSNVVDVVFDATQHKLPIYWDFQ